MSEKYRSFGRACPTCGRSQYEHPNNKVSLQHVYDTVDGVLMIVGQSRGCDLRLITEKTMKDGMTGEVIPYQVTTTDSPFPRTKEDPRRFVHSNNIPRR